MLSFLGGYHDYTVGTTCTIDSRGRHILQDFDALDVGRIQERHGIERSIGSPCIGAGSGGVVINNEAIDNVKRFVATRDGVASTDADGAGSTRLSATRGHVNTSHGALQHALHGRDVLVEQFFTHRGDTGGEFLTLLHAITHNDYLTEAVAAWHKLYFKWFFGIIDVHVQCSVTHILHTECEWQFYIRLECEVSFNICNGTQFPTILRNQRSTDERLSCTGIRDTARDGGLRFSSERQQHT